MLRSSIPFTGWACAFRGLPISAPTSLPTAPLTKSKWGGLSPAGKALLAEMNGLGVVPDLPHRSDHALDDPITLSKAPLILTHSGCRAVFDHPRINTIDVKAPKV